MATSDWLLPASISRLQSVALLVFLWLRGKGSAPKTRHHSEILRFQGCIDNQSKTHTKWPRIQFTSCVATTSCSQEGRSFPSIMGRIPRVPAPPNCQATHSVPGPLLQCRVQLLSCRPNTMGCPRIDMQAPNCSRCHASPAPDLIRPAKMARIALLPPSFPYLLLPSAEDLCAFSYPSTSSPGALFTRSPRLDDIPFIVFTFY